MCQCMHGYMILRPISTAWLGVFDLDCLDTCCFECLVYMCFVFLCLHLFSAIEQVLHGKAL